MKYKFYLSVGSSSGKIEERHRLLHAVCDNFKFLFRRRVSIRRSGWKFALLLGGCLGFLHWKGGLASITGKAFFDFPFCGIPAAGGRSQESCGAKSGESSAEHGMIGWMWSHTGTHFIPAPGFSNTGKCQIRIFSVSPFHEPKLRGYTPTLMKLYSRAICWSDVYDGSFQSSRFPEKKNDVPASVLYTIVEHVKNSMVWFSQWLFIRTRLKSV